ncbi:NADH-quinone oxidoreductase subunit C [Aeoliella mucimassa]|uniref:NADH-quinone oxidoreductase subunit C n=1 Tax=Aeoliella mucimassa TaxID=2527972 RepID=A0A518ARX3_9BACT|nr:NADH-quinone oxidoreductase subunit C [Aeoliella mucimassa]QDU57470.1 NADH-quinone oxidoreductase subunit 5 [Aeoliella mucimassa]
MADFTTIHKVLTERFPGATMQAVSEAVDPWIEVSVDDWPRVAQFLKDEPTLAFNYLNCITGVDYCEPDEKKAKKVKWQPHIELLYHLTSLQHKHLLVVKLMLPRWQNDEPEMIPQVPTVSNIWRTADWHEREVYDLVGIEFTGHPDLRRILCPEDWQGHPLRKDYEMPLEYHGIRGR